MRAVDNRTAHLRFLALVAAVLGGVSLVLAVRRAVGASDRQIIGWYTSQWARIVVPGFVGGWVLQALWTSALVTAIQGLQAPTVSMVVCGTGLMAVAAASAAMVPLRRALASDSSTLRR